MVGLAPPAGLPDNPFSRRPPLTVWIIALLAAILHLAPFLLAAHNTPQGWSFTWILTPNVDVMQYRTWLRHTQQTGLISDNSLTAEPNKAHLPLLLYWFTGKLAETTWLPEAVFVWLGAGFAFVLILLVYQIAVCFLEQKQAVWVVFLALIAAGGLGTHQKLITQFSYVRIQPILRQILYDPFLGGRTGGLVFEDYRGSYLVLSLTDTHFLVVWTAAAAAMLAIFMSMQRSSGIRLVTAVAFSALTTVLHVYTGVTALACIALILLLCWRRGILSTTVLATCLACAVSILLVVGGLFALQRVSGLPPYQWRGNTQDLVLVLMAYPLPFLIIIPSLYRYWQRTGLRECFLLGWAGGCLAVLLSGPVYAYPARGMVGATIPLYMIAAQIYYSGRRRMSLPAAALAFVMLAPALPLKAFYYTRLARFNENAPHMFLSADHRAIVATLRRVAGRDDLMVAEPRDLLWLAPEFPGKQYCAHFFLTVDFPQKSARVNQFWSDPPEGQAKFLAENSIRFVFAAPEHNLGSVPGLQPVVANRYGTLLEYTQHP